MVNADRTKWDAKYSEKRALESVTPDDWLRDCVLQIEHSAAAAESSGPLRAIEFACGLGHNAIWLAERGWQVDAIDVSEVGLTLAKNTATKLGASVNWITADIDQFAVQPQQYDLAVVFRFIDRQHLPRLIDSAVETGGWLVYETFSSSQLLRTDNHIRNSNFTLKPEELPKLFPNFTAESHHERSLEDRTVLQFLGRKSP